MNAPFIKLYDLCCGYYFYDIPKNAIISVNKNTYRKLQELCKFGYNKFEEIYNNSGDINYLTIKKLMKQNYLSNSQPLQIFNPYTEYAEEYTNKCLSNMLLQITQMCNFKCEYCPYSGNGLFDRTHNDKSMSIETALKSVDFLIERSLYSKELTIGFYGGEPLLKFDLIKAVVEYAEKKATNKSVSFGITTNGYLINNEMVTFFKEHKFSLVISFDGPKHIHDKNRRLMANGLGTFDHVYANMKILKENGVNFGINAVWDTEEGFNEIVDFFKSDSLLFDVNINIEQVMTGRIGTGYNVKEESEYQEEAFTVKTYLNYLGLYGELTNQQNDYVIKPYELIANQINERDGMPNIFHHGGPCIPGYLRLFIDIDGVFYPCEKVSGMSKIMQIGSVEEGFNLPRIKELLNVGSVTEFECKSCWAMNLCGICGMWADNNENCFCKKSKLNRCGFIKSVVNKNIINYIILSEIKYLLNGGD